MLASCTTVDPVRATGHPAPTGPGGVSATEAATAGLPGSEGGSRALELNRKLLTLSRPGPETDLPLDTGDLVEVSVFDVPELSSIKARVPQSGDITLPLIGGVRASGRTARELQGDIEAVLRVTYMHEPHVSVFVQEQKSQRISVIGAVRQGGVLTLTSPLRLADALAMAGGLTEEAGSIVHLVRQPAEDSRAIVKASLRSGDEDSSRTEPVISVIDLERLASGREELNLPLRSGDVVEVPRAGTFYVGGEVNRAGAFALKGHMTLDQAPMAAGGVRDVGDHDDVRLYRTNPDGTRDVTRYSLEDFEAGQPAPELQANDIVIVGKSSGKAFLYALRDLFRLGVSMSMLP
jgi:polysaccharide export outer membrane protein